MSDASNSVPPAPQPPAPHVDPTALKEIASGVYVITDRRIPLVPNIGIILGSGAALVVDTGMGPVNGQKVLDCAKKLAGGRPLIVTLTHFHPEHGFGAQAFKGRARNCAPRAKAISACSRPSGRMSLPRLRARNSSSRTKSTKVRRLRSISA